jgi:membrane-bound lytic murein transglycosylase D
MRSVFREKGLPVELVNLAFVESGVNPRATSPAKAAGIWQFVPSTARSYGMRRTGAIDERRDPEKSTRAAAEYLKRLYERFDSWPLALAAYNAGEGTLERAIARQRTTDFWRLRLPKETERFVPTFMAMTLIARDPRRYGFSPPPEEPHDTDVLYVGQPTEIQHLAVAAGTSVEHLRELNPELIGRATPSDRTPYALRIPGRFAWVAHKIQPGETIAAIAKRYGVTPHVLREANKLGERGEPKAGTVILVPTNGPPA